MMVSFKPFLSPKASFSWTEELHDTFIRSKEEIIKAIEQGVCLSDPRKKHLPIRTGQRLELGIGFIRSIFRVNHRLLIVVLQDGKLHLPVLDFYD